MIKYTDKRSDIIELWQEAFGDSFDDIEFFIRNVKNARCLAYYNEDNIISMFFLVDCTCLEQNGKYIYAACTKTDFRKKGIMSELLNYAKENSEDFICLIPANENLSEYYKSRGFTYKTDIQLIRFNQVDDIKEYLFEGCELEKPYILMFKGE